MSIRSITAIAIQRESKAPTRVSGITAEGQDIKAPQSWADALVAAIPSEPLAIYTALIGTIVATITAGDSHLLMRWILYAVGIVVVVAWISVGFFRGRSAKARKFPWVESFAAAVAFASWGLVMPGSPLSVSLSSENQVIWTAIITAAGVLVVAALAVPLKDPSK